MPDLEKQLKALRDPINIKNANLASSAYVLRKAFAADPQIRELIAAKDRVVPFVGEEMRASEPLDDITLAALAYIIESVKPDAAPEILGAQFKKSVEDPGPFFVYFAAHAIRSGLKRSIKGIQMDYSRVELLETRDLLQ
jgi:hypothetical protein